MIHSEKPRSQGLVDIITHLSQEYVKPVPVLAYHDVYMFVHYIPLDNLPELLGYIIEDAIAEGERNWMFDVTHGGGCKENENDWCVDTPVELFKECYFGEEAPELYGFLYECGEERSINEFETPIQIIFSMQFYNLP